MEIKERIAYIRGLLEGADFYGRDERGRAVWENLLGVCGQLADSIAALEEEQAELGAYLEAVDADLADLEEAADVPEYVVVECPHCGEESALKKSSSTMTALRWRALSVAATSRKLKRRKWRWRHPPPAESAPDPFPRKASPSNRTLPDGTRTKPNHINSCSQPFRWAAGIRPITTSRRVGLLRARDSVLGGIPRDLWTYSVAHVPRKECVPWTASSNEFCLLGS